MIWTRSALCMTLRPPARCCHGAWSVLSAWMNPTKAPHTATASLAKSTAFIQLCGQQLNSPPLSPEFCMRAKAAMWKRGLRDGGKRGWEIEKVMHVCYPLCLFSLLFGSPLSFSQIQPNLFVLLFTFLVTHTHLYCRSLFIYLWPIL